MTQSPHVTIDTDLGTEYQDAGPWRSYRLYASGRTIQELALDATIEEVDQDGGTLRSYGLYDGYGDHKVIDEAMAIIRSKGALA